jgi:hypothetical protein
MGKIKGYVQDFLETVGFGMGYDWDNLPSMSEMEDLMSSGRNNPILEPTDNELKEIESEVVGDIDISDLWDDELI